MHEPCVCGCDTCITKVSCMQVAVVLSEKVDTTLSKGVLRIGGTVVGGTLGEHMTPPDIVLAQECRQCHGQATPFRGCPARAAVSGCSLDPCAAPQMQQQL